MTIEKILNSAAAMDRRKIGLGSRKPFISRKHFAFLIGTTVACLFTIISILQSNQNDLNPQLSRSSEEQLPHPFNLTENVRVLCWIMTTPANHESKALHAKRTWGRRCNKLLLMSSATDEKVGTIALPVGEGRQHLWNKTREAFRYVHEHHLNEFDWFMKADDDTYVIVENLRYFLYPYSPEFPIYFGSKFRYPEYVKQGYFSGGAGYVLSREALKRFVDESLEDSEHCSTTYETEDLEMGKCMESVNVTAGDSRDLFGRKRFLPMEPVFHLTSDPTEDPNFWYNYYSFYEPFYGEKCCSDLAISFHYVGGLQMYAMDYMIYGLHPYGISHRSPELPPKKNWEEAMVVAGPYPATTTARATTLAEDATTEVTTETTDGSSGYPESASGSINGLSYDGTSLPYSVVSTGLEQSFESSSNNDSGDSSTSQNI